MSNPITIDVWSDIACPFCYMGKRKLEMALAQFKQADDAPAVEITYHSFELQPDMPVEFSGSHDAYIAERMGWTPEQVRASGERVAQMAAAVGLDFRSEIQMTNTAKAHELLHHAKAHGQQAEMKDRLLRAYFSEGRHVGRVNDLADLAAEIGLDRDEAVRALETGQYREAVEADKAQAARYGVRGVPFYVIDGKYGVSGAQEPGTFLQALTQVAAEREIAS